MAEDSRPTCSSVIISSATYIEYEAVRSRPKLWRETVLVIVYDECGGYWDSVMPQEPVPPPTEDCGKSGVQQEWWPTDHMPYNFTWQGPRVPCVVIGAHIDPHIDSRVCEHASIPASLKHLWDLESKAGPEGFLTQRDRHSPSIFDSIAFTQERLRLAPRDDLETLPRAPVAVGPEGSRRIGWSGRHLG
jgi:phospholipase C